MHLNIGDHVRILNETQEGVVSKIIDEDEIYVRTPDGFDFPYKMNELIKVNEEEAFVEFKVNDAALSGMLDREGRDWENRQKEGVTYLKPYLEKGMLSNKRGDAIVEIDLHLEELVSHPQRLNNWEKIHVQIEHCKHCLEEAMRLKVNQLVFIHGVGEGRLKEEIRNLISSYSNIECFDADYSRYGSGATQVRIRGLFI